MAEVYYAQSQLDKKSVTAVSVLVAALLVLSAHVAGFKIYGTAEFVDNQPLHRPRKVIDITADGAVVISGGQNYFVHGVEMIRRNPLGDIRYFQWQSSTLEVEVHDPWKAVSRMDARLRVMWLDQMADEYRFFPGRINKYSKADMAEILVIHGAAIPRVGLFEDDPGYARRLMLHLRGTVANLQIDVNTGSAQRLGEYLLEHRDDFFATGAWLLAHCGDSSVAWRVEQRIEYLMSAADGSGPVPWRFKERVSELISILAAVAPARAGDMAMNIIERQPGRHPELKVRLASHLADIGKWDGFDRLMEEITDRNLPGSYRRVLCHELDGIFQYSVRAGGFSGHAELMRQWYKDNKPEFHWDSRGGSVAMAGDSAI